jgi:hypothetical protein
MRTLCLQSSRDLRFCGDTSTTGYNPSGEFGTIFAEREREREREREVINHINILN